MKDNRNQLTTAIRYALGAGVIAGLAATAAPAFAQDQEEEEEAAGLERVQVTGSRIRRTDVEGTSPVLRFDREDLLASGVTNVQDFVRTLTIATSQNFDTFTNSFANATSQVDLRGLGGQSTLVLINGRRIAPFGQGQNITESFVDLNTIPFQAIERIEILKDGASAIYGSDALAGVVNIILRTDYQGAEVQLDWQDTTQGDASEKSFSAIFGSGAGDTSFTMNFNYLSRDAMSLTDRPFSEDADNRPFGGGDERSFFAFPGTLINLTDLTSQAAPNCAAREGSGISDFGGFGTFCRFDYADFINTFPDSETFATNAFFDHRINQNHSFFGEFNYTHRRAVNISAPAPFTTRNEAVDDIIIRNSDLTADTIGRLGGLLLPGSFNLLFPGDNPFNPTGEDAGLVHRPLDIGPRTQEQTVNTFRVIAGLEGSLAPTWQYETAVFYSRNFVLGENRNSIFKDDLQRALLGQLETADGNSPYYDPFTSQNSDALLAALRQTNVTRNTTVDQGVDAQLTGSLLQLPAGELGIAVGGEFRELSLIAENSPDRNSGNLVGTGSASDTRGERKVTSLYAEAIVPIIHTLEAQVAVRWEDYSDFGTTTNPKVGLKWEPIDGLLVRGSWGESFRAPSLFELFNGSVSSFQGVTDPFRCPDGPAGDNFDFTSDIDCGNGQFRVENGGNPLLDPETADAYNVGFVWSPDFIPGFSMAADFWRFEMEDVIQSFPLNVLLQLNDPSAVVRGDPSPEAAALGVPGPIQFINNSFVNAGQQDTQGLDFDLSYAFQTGIGAFRTEIQGTYFDEFELTTPDLDDETGEIVDVTFQGVGSTLLGTRPEWQLRGGVTWQMADHQVNGFVNFRDSVDSSTDLQVTGEPYTISSFTTVDLQYTYDLTQNLTLSAGCINCLDREPPFNNEDFEGFLLDSDDPRGARWYGRAIFRF